MIDILIVVATSERFLIEGMMRDIITCLYTDKAFNNKFIKLNRADNTIQIDEGIYIDFCTANENCIRRYRPDYFLTNSKNADEYLTAVGAKKLSNRVELLSVMKEEICK